MAAAYGALVASGAIEEDPAQLELAGLLDTLLVDLDKKHLSSKSSSLGWLFSKGRKSREPVKGYYIWGSVGRGKSMLMDQFYTLVTFPNRRRVHFNDFMVNVHERIHAQRQAFKQGKTKEKDPIPPVARALAREAELLCFDEFTVTDIADAMLLGRLFTDLFDRGVVVVATSNVAPSDLYRDGLNRSLFLPFIETLGDHVRVFELDARTDFRLEKVDHAPVYLTPLGDHTSRAMNAAWKQLTNGGKSQPQSLTVKGRTLKVSRAVDGIARFSFEELCKQPRSAADYLALVREYHTLFVDNVPVMGEEDRNAAKRFILLIDTLYDNRAQLVISAAASPNALYHGRRGTEAFEFDRTASRLIEMQSKDYLAGM